MNVASSIELMNYQPHSMPTVLDVVNYAIQFGTVIVVTHDFIDIDDGRFYVGDCLEVMKELPDASIDMILCDLPYGTTQNKWDSVISFEPLWKEYKRICRGAIVLTAQCPFDKTLGASNIEMLKH